MLLICFTVVVFSYLGIYIISCLFWSHQCVRKAGLSSLRRKGGGGHVYLATIRSAHYICIAMLIQMFLMRETLDASVGLLWA